MQPRPIGWALLQKPLPAKGPACGPPHLCNIRNIENSSQTHHPTPHQPLQLPLPRSRPGSLHPTQPPGCLRVWASQGIHGARTFRCVRGLTPLARVSPSGGGKGAGWGRRRRPTQPEPRIPLQLAGHQTFPKRFHVVPGLRPSPSHWISPGAVGQPRPHNSAFMLAHNLNVITQNQG